MAGALVGQVSCSQSAGSIGLRIPALRPDPRPLDAHPSSPFERLRRVRKLVRVLRPDEQILVEDLSLIDTSDPNRPDAAPMVENIAG